MTPSCTYARQFTFLWILFLAIPILAQPSATSPVQWVHQSREAVGTGNYQDAREMAQQAVKQDPGYPDGWKQLGRIDMLMGNFPPALEAFDNFSLFDPEDADVRHWRFLISMEDEDVQAVVRKADELSHPQFLELGEPYVLRLISLALDNQQVRTAQRMLKRWRKVVGKENSGKAAIILSHILEKDLRTARHDLKTLSDTPTPSPIEAYAWWQLGLVYLENEEEPLARDAMQQALNLRPNWIPALRDLGWLYYRDGKMSLAISAWEKGIPQGYPAWGVWVAEAYYTQEQPLDALNTVTHSLDLDPTVPGAHVLKLMGLLVLDRSKEATSFSASLAARDIELAHARAELYLKQHAQAADRLVQLVHTLPADTEVSSLLTQVYRDWLRESPNNIEVLLRLSELHPDDPAIWRDLGWAYWAHGDQEPAIDAFDKAVRGEVKNNDELIVQVFAALSESNQGDRAMTLQETWRPDTDWADLGSTLVHQGRALAATPALERAWADKNPSPETGLYLTYAHALQGQWEHADISLLPYARSMQTRTNVFDQEIVLQSMLKIGGMPGSLNALEHTLTYLRSIESFPDTLTELLQAAAARRSSYQDDETAFAFYLEVMERDPNRNVWSQADRAAERLNRQQDSIQLLQETLKHTSHDVIRLGIQGRLAEHDQRWDQAVQLYEQSIGIDPHQPIVRFALFTLLLREGRVDDARKHVEWFVQKVESGESSGRVHLAEMFSSLGDSETSLSFWDALRREHPRSPYYTIGTARVLIRLCRVEEARSILDTLVQQNPDPRAYLLLGEIMQAQGQHKDALVMAHQGLDIERMKSLLRLQAESAERIEDFPLAVSAATELLAENPGNVPMSRILGRAQIKLEHWDEAEAHYLELLERNPAFLPALLRLREIYTARREFKEAVSISKTLVKQRPWDPEMKRLLAISQAEADHFRAALKTLRGLADRPVSTPTPILVYDRPTLCPASGRVSAPQIQAHLLALKNDGYHFTDPATLFETNVSKRVMVILSRASTEVLDALDDTAQELEIRLVAAASLAPKQRHVPSEPNLEFLQKLAQSGRWVIASAGPFSLHPIPVRNDGLFGTPLTHSKVIGITHESAEDYRARLDQALATDEQLPLFDTTLFLYPGGDAGQYSLDTTPQDLRVFQNAVDDQFDVSVISDSLGYATPHSTSSPFPGRYVPAGWEAHDLLTHLQNRHPTFVATLQLAKVLYWNRQHEKANRAFARALDMGADAAEIRYHWGANAYMQGDLPQALHQLRQAQTLRPNDERREWALARTEIKTHPGGDLQASYSEDSENREFHTYGGELFTHVFDQIAVQAFLNHQNWRRDGLGDEYGEQFGASLRLYPLLQTWIKAELWRLDFSTKELDDLYGGAVHARLPSTWLSGHINLAYDRVQIETVEAVRRGIHADQYALQTYSRLLDEFDLYLNLIYAELNDGNEITSLDGRIVWRAKEWPFLGLGYLVRFSDGEFDPDEYYAPEDLEQHQLYVSTRGAYNWFHYALSARAGYNREADTDWRFIWGARLLLEAKIKEHMTLYGEGIYQKSDTYDKNTVRVGVKGNL